MLYVHQLFNGDYLHSRDSMNVTFDELVFLAYVYARNSRAPSSKGFSSTAISPMVRSLVKRELVYVEEKIVTFTESSKIVYIVRPSRKLLVDIRNYNPAEVVAAFIRAGEEFVTDDSELDSCLGCATQWIMHRCSKEHLAEFLASPFYTIRNVALQKIKNLPKRERIPFA